MATVSGSLIFDKNRSGGFDVGETGIGNVSIVLQDINSGARVTCTTNLSGAFSFINVPNGSYRLVEAYGEPAGTSNPADFSSAVVGVSPVSMDPPISNTIAPPVGATNLDSTTPNTIFVTVTGSDVTGQNIFDGPVKYTPITSILDSCAIIENTNLITVADNGTFGIEPAGSPADSGPLTAPYPSVTPGFTYRPPTLPTDDGYYTVTNILIPPPGFSWWRLTNRLSGDETGRAMYINGDFPGATFFQQTANVNPNTKYIFTTWIANIVNVIGLVPPMLGVEILDQNGGILYSQNLGNSIPASTTVPEWKQIGTVFDSGNNTQVTVKFLSEAPRADGNDYAIDEVRLQPIIVPTFTPVKSVDKAYANVGDVVTYTVTLANTCGSPLTSVFFKDVLPPELQFVLGSSTGGTNPVTDNPNSGFNVPNIAGNSTATITFKAKVLAIPAANPILNVATTNYNYTPVQGGIPNSFSTESNPVPLTINNANLNIIKSVDKTNAIVGDTVLYTLNIINTGNVPASSVVITDILPNGTSYVSGSLLSTVAVTGDPTTSISVTNPIPSLATIIINFQAKIDTLPVPNPMVNTASGAYNFLVDPNGAPVSGSNISNPVRTDVGTENISKSVDKSNATVGDILTYTVKATNPGTAPVFNAVFTDPLPSGVTYADSLTVDTAYTGTDPMSGITITQTNPGQTVTISWKVQVGSSIPTPNPIQNIGTITLPSGTQFKTNPATTQINEAILKIAKSADKKEAAVGDIVTYTLNVTNIGNTSASSVVITDPVPVGASYVSGSIIANVGFTGDPTTTINLTLPLPASATATISYKVKINQLPTPNPMPNTATANYNYLVQPDGAIIPSSNTSNTINIPVGEVIATKSVDKAYADLGDVVTYTVTLTNPGLAPVNNVIFQDLLPNGMTYADSLSVSVPYTGTSPITGLVISSVPAGGSITISWKATVMYDIIPVPNPVVNVGTITTAAGTNIPTNGASTKINHADLISGNNFVKSVDKSNVQPGDVVTYTITVKNTGNAAANNVVINDSIPSGTTYVPGSITSTAAFTGSPLTSIQLTAPVSPGDTVIITFKVKIGNAIPSTNPIPNQATIAYDYTVDPADPNGVSVNGFSNVVDVTVATANLVTRKTVDKSISYIGDTLTYNIAITNTGNIPANTVVVTDPIPNGTVYVPGSLTVSVPYSGSPLTTINLTNPIAPGATVAISFKVTVTAIPNPNPINNVAKVSYKFTVNPQDPNGVSVTSTSNPATTKVFKYNFSKEITDLIDSIALEQAALAAIADAEGKKIQTMVAMGSITNQELLCLNKSVSDMIDSMSILESILKQKLNSLGCQINSPCM